MANDAPMTPPTPDASPPDPQALRRSRVRMILLFLFFALPVLASYFTYYVIRPQGRTNYGELIEPQRDAKGLALTAVPAPGAPAGAVAGPTALGDLKDLRLKWLMVTVGPSRCDEACARRLYFTRQVRKTAGAEMERVERLWLLTDEALPDPALLAQHEGLRLYRVDAAALEALMRAAPGTRSDEHIHMIDPYGNLMMRFPKDPDPSKMKKDLAKLLRASQVR